MNDSEALQRMEAPTHRSNITDIAALFDSLEARSLRSHAKEPDVRPEWFARCGEVDDLLRHDCIACAVCLRHAWTCIKSALRLGVMRITAPHGWK